MKLFKNNSPHLILTDNGGVKMGDGRCLLLQGPSLRVRSREEAQKFWRTRKEPGRRLIETTTMMKVPDSR